MNANQIDQEWGKRSASERVKERSENGQVFHLIPPAMQHDQKFLFDAVKANPHVIRDIINQTPELNEAAVEGDWRAIRHIRRPSYELCQKALLASMHERDKCYGYLRNADSGVWYRLMKNGAEALRHCPQDKIDKAACWHACNFDLKALEYVPERFMSYELCDHVWKIANDELKREIFPIIPEKFRNGPFSREALRIDPALLEFVPERVQLKIPDACERALAHDPDAERFLRIDCPRPAMGMAM